MANFKSTYPGDLVLPDGEVIKNEAEIDLSKDALANAGVKAWIEDGFIQELKPAAKKNEAAN